MENKQFQNNLNNKNDTKEEEKFVWLARIFVILLSIGVISNLVLLWTFVSIVPNTKIQPLYIKTKDADNKNIFITKNLMQFANSLPDSERNLYNTEFEYPGYYLAQNLIKKYVIDRETYYPNVDFVNEMWGQDSELFYMSEEKLYNNFINSPKTKSLMINAGKGVGNIITATLTEAPRLADKLETKAPEWLITITVIEKSPNGQIISSKVKNIKLKAVFNPNVLVRDLDSKSKNPLGFTVYQYLEY